MQFKLASLLVAALASVALAENATIVDFPAANATGLAYNFTNSTAAEIVPSHNQTVVAVEDEEEDASAGKKAAATNGAQPPPAGNPVTPVAPVVPPAPVTKPKPTTTTTKAEESTTTPAAAVDDAVTTGSNVEDHPNNNGTDGYVRGTLGPVEFATRVPPAHTLNGTDADPSGQKADGTNGAPAASSVLLAVAAAAILGAAC